MHISMGPIRPPSYSQALLFHPATGQRATNAIGSSEESNDGVMLQPPLNSPVDPRQSSNAPDGIQGHTPVLHSEMVMRPAHNTDAVLLPEERAVEIGAATTAQHSVRQKLNGCVLCAYM